MEEDIKEAYIESYKEIKRNKDVVKSIDKDYFFEFADYLINRNKELEEEKKECIFLEDGTEECLWMCSNCKDEWMFYDGTPEDNRLRYCPFCGAKVIKYKSYIEQEKELAEELLED